MKDVIWKLAGFLTVLGMAASALTEPERWIGYAAIGGVLLVIVAAVAVPRRSAKRGYCRR